MCANAAVLLQVICLEWGADLHVAQLMPLPPTVSCFSKIQIGFTFLAPAHSGSPGKRAVTRMCVCVRACVPNVPDLMHCCWQKVKSQIYAEYKKLKSDSNYANDRRVCEYLHRKLSHIKHVVLQYDQAKLGHWRRMFTRMLVSVQQLICQIPFKSEFVPESWDQIFKTYWDDFKKNLGKWPNL